MISPLDQHCLDSIFLPNVAFAEILDLDAVLGCQSLGILAQRVAKCFGKPRIVAVRDPPSSQPLRCGKPILGSTRLLSRSAVL